MSSRPQCVADRQKANLRIADTQMMLVVIARDAEDDDGETGLGDLMGDLPNPGVDGEIVRNEHDNPRSGRRGGSRVVNVSIRGGHEDGPPLSDAEGKSSE